MKKYLMLVAAAALLMSCGTMKKGQVTNDEYYTAALTDLSVQTKVEVNTL